MSVLLNLVGLTIGLVLYAMLLWMVIGGRHQSTGVDRVALATAMLGLVWNACALSIYGYPAAASRWVTVCGFSALGFLPAVVVHSVVRGDSRNRKPAGVVLRTIAYGASTVAAVLHAEAALASLEIPSVFSLRLLTACFIVMLVPLARITVGQPEGRRALWIVALAAFAVSALHLSQYEQTASAWPIEVIGHHASIPLAMAILYQDYPFAFADLFLKRAFTLIGLVGAVSFAIYAASFSACRRPHRKEWRSSWRSALAPRSSIRLSSAGPAGSWTRFFSRDPTIARSRASSHAAFTCTTTYRI
jgi:hypothetical protein